MNENLFDSFSYPLIFSMGLVCLPTNLPSLGIQSPSENGNGT